MGMQLRGKGISRPLGKQAGRPGGHGRNVGHANIRHRPEIRDEAARLFVVPDESSRGIGRVVGDAAPVEHVSERLVDISRGRDGHGKFRDGNGGGLRCRRCRQRKEQHGERENASPSGEGAG